MRRSLLVSLTVLVSFFEVVDTARAQQTILDTIPSENLACEGSSYKLLWQPNYGSDYGEEEFWMATIQNHLDESIYSGGTMIHAHYGEFYSDNCWCFYNAGTTSSCDCCGGGAIRSFVDYVVVSYEINPCAYVGSHGQQLLCSGCTAPNAHNYNEFALYDDGSCIFDEELCGEGAAWDEQLEQCVVIESCQEDLDYDGVIGVNDLMSLLASFGTDCSSYEEEIGCGTPIEYHGYEYQTVLIGDQCWFAENLRTELFLNGEEIPSGLDRETWCNATYGATTYYAETADSCISDPSVNFPGGWPNTPCDDPEGALEFYGRLYNWHAVNDERELCPSGWHVPSSAEWLTLKEYVDASYPYHSGLVLREHGSWRNPVTGLDLFGFKLRPAGYRSYWNGEGPHYRSAGRVGTWFWTTDNGSDVGTAYSFDHKAFNEINSLVMQNLQGPSQNQHQFGFSVRCIKD